MREWINDRVWVLKAFWLIRRDLFRLMRLYPATWSDSRFREAVGHIFVREGKRLGDESFVEAGQALTSGEFIPQ